MEFCYRIRVRFADTDAAGVAHFSRMLCWVEEAEHEAWAQRGFAAHGSSARAMPAPVGWPRVGLEVKFRAPVVVDDVLAIGLRPRRVGGRALAWEFEMRKLAAGDAGGAARGDVDGAWGEGGAGERGVLVAEGVMSVVAVQREKDGAWGSVTVPVEMVRALGLE